MKNSSLIKLIVAILVLAAIGVAFAYIVIIPASLKFFAGYSNGQIKPLINADDYLNFIISCLTTFALLFQIPLIVSFIDHIRPMKPGQLLRYQRHVVVAAFVLAVVLPFTYDPITQFVIAAPVVVLFYVSVVIIALMHFRRTRRHKKISAAQNQYQQAGNGQLDKIVATERTTTLPSRASVVATPTKSTRTTKPSPKRIPRPQPALVIDGLSPRPVRFSSSSYNQHS